MKKVIIIIITFILITPQQAVCLRPAATETSYAQTRTTSQRLKAVNDFTLQANLSKLLHESLFTIPYNSFSAVFHVVDVVTPEELGGNCVYQAQVLGDQIIQRIKDAKDMFYLVDDRHHAVVVESTGGKMFYLDPYLMQAEAIEIPSSSMTSEVSAYPCQYGKMGKVALKREGSMLFINKLIAKPSADEYLLTHSFKYDLENPKKHETSPLNDRNIALHPEVTTLSMRTLTEQGGIIAYIYNIPEDRIYILNPFHEKIPLENEAEFKKWFQMLMDLLHTGQEEFLQYTDEGIRAYKILTENMEINYIYPNAVNAVVIEPPFNTTAAILSAA